MSASPAPAVAPTGPSLRLIAPASHLGVRRSEGKVSLTTLGLRVGSLRRALEIHVWRPAFGEPFKAGIFDARSETKVRGIPRRLLATDAVNSPFTGPNPAPFPRLRHFIKVTFHRPNHTVAGRGTIPFCPAGLRERLNDNGPQLSRYPFSCSSFSLFVRGLVWGIDRDWATPPLDFGGPDPRVKLQPGDYRVVAKITRRYRRMFGISSAAATARMDVVVHKGGGGPIPKPVPPQPKREGSKRPAKGVPTVDNPPAGATPDLAALPAWNVAIDSPGSRDLLTFSATEWNAGPAPLDVEGFRRVGRRHMRAFQYFRDGQGRIVGRIRAGGMEYDPRVGHHHWHFLQFAHYTLLDASRHNVVTSHKEAFCIAPTDLVDLTVPGADWGTNTSGFFTACGDKTSLWVREVLAAGWGDTYLQTVAGQAFGIKSVPNGRYFIKIEVNPKRKLIEAKRANDVALRRIRLGGTPGHRTVQIAPWHGIPNF